MESFEKKIGALALLALSACGAGGSAASPSFEAPDATLPPPPIPAPPDAGEDVVPRGARVLGLVVTSAETEGPVAALARARDAGAQSTNVTVRWPELESAPDAGDGGAPDGGDAGITYFDPVLHIANLELGDFTVSLAVNAVDSTGPLLPADLAGRALDDPRVIARFDAAQDYVFGEIPDMRVSSYVLADDVDDALGADSAKWAQFTAFFATAAAHARRARAGLKVGVVASMAGAVSRAAELAPVVAASDFLAVSYYPVNPDFRAQSPSQIRAAVDALVAAWPRTPLLVREAGYPSDAANGSSPAQQAEVVGELFRAWDAYARQIPQLTLFALTDDSPQVVDEVAAYYGVTDPKFKSYIGSLGLRTYPGAGADKPAWTELAREARARGW